MPARIIYDYMHVMNLTSFKIEQHQGTREKSEFIRQMQHRPLTTEEIKVHWAHDLGVRIPQLVLKDILAISPARQICSPKRHKE